jgi:hypothetical protein
MLVNKWIQFGLSALIGVLGVAAGWDWTAVVGVATAGKVVAGIALVKGVTNILAPAPGTTAAPSSGSVITHKSS